MHGQIATELQEIRQQLSSDVRDLGSRLTDAFDEIEKLRRVRSAKVGGGGFEATRNTLEKNAGRNPQLSRAELVALAEG